MFKIDRLWHWITRSGASAASAPGRTGAVSLEWESARQRLGRLGRWCRDGRIAAAELDLHEWVRHGAAPQRATALLAALLARRGRWHDALHLLRAARRGDGERDVAVRRLHITVLTCLGLEDAARRAALRLHQAHGQDRAVADWLTMIEAPGSADLPAVSDAEVALLSRELALQPHLLPTLVAAQKVQPDARLVTLLRKALLHLAPPLRDEEDQLSCCIALAELGLLADDADDARRWAHRGLRLQPYSATCALVLAQLGDDPAAGPRAVDVLTRVAEAFPQYPDVRAALIRREFAAGYEDDARLRIAHWLDREPGSALARRLERELAA